ncbi:MAG TPA: DUF1080 domain-containing protein [Opitutaceae bacterium]|jgi:hypothetical protein|nr:DUF1080 domain-containing protein [Opitutaceae bacterium]
MKTSLVSSLLALSLLTLAAPAAQAAEHNVLTSAERADGWQLLFDGTTLKGWRSLKAGEPGDGWKVIDGTIARVGKSGDILTGAEYGDFELSIQWKVADETNSGILYRVGLTESQTYYTGPEYQLLDNIAGGDRFDPKHRAGALYDLVAPPSDVTKPVGVWNETRIIVRGWHVQHWLNGVKLVDVDLASPEGQDLVLHSKFHKMPHFATLASGHIALQDHDGMVSFRDIKVRDLKGTN